jgi:hypothetical protein
MATGTSGPCSTIASVAGLTGCALAQTAATNFYNQALCAASTTVSTAISGNATTFPIVNIQSTSVNPTPALTVNGGMNSSFLCVGGNISASGPLTVHENLNTGGNVSCENISIYTATGLPFTPVGTDQVSFSGDTILMQYGTATFTSIQITVTFPTPFVSLPTVFATPTVKFTGDPHNTATIPVTNITLTNFTICINSTCTGTLPSPAPTFNWMAFGPF